MHIILATLEAEIRKITVQSQHKQIAHQTLSQKYLTHNRASGLVVTRKCKSSKQVEENNMFM
jgi:hypothetical protein